MSIELTEEERELYSKELDQIIAEVKQHHPELSYPKIKKALHELLEYTI